VLIRKHRAYKASSRHPSIESLEDRRLLAVAAVFNNNTDISIPEAGTDGPADPYPSNIQVSGLVGVVTDVDVTLHNLNHEFPDDVETLLVSPSGTTTILMSDQGDAFDVSAIDLTFDDSAPGTLGDEAPLISGTFAPANFGGGDTFSAPAPAGPHGTTLASHNGIAPNGSWSLFIEDDSGNDVGSLDEWSLKLTVTPFTEVAVSDGNLLITDTLPGGKPDDLTIVIDAGDYVISDSTSAITGTGFAGDGTGEVRVPIAPVSGNILFDLGQGDDSVTFDNSGGLISPIVEVNAGPGDDSLTFAGDLELAEAAYQPGPLFESGTVTHVVPIIIAGEGDPGTVEPAELFQTVHFAGVEPTLDVTMAPSLMVAGTDAANAIEVRSGDFGGAVGVVSVDGFERFAFSNKAQLVLNARAGSDEIHLSDINDIADLDEVIVNGEGPSAETDTVILLGRVGDQDAITYTATSDDSASVNLNGSVVMVHTVERFVFDGGGDSEFLLINGDGGNSNEDIFVHQPGAAPDSGTFRQTADGESMLGISYENLGPTMFLSIFSGEENGRLIVEGSTGDDLFDISFPVTDAAVIDLATSGVEHVRLTASSTENIEFHGLAGNDQFDTTAPLDVAGEIV